MIKRRIRERTSSLTKFNDKMDTQPLKTNGFP